MKFNPITCLMSFVLVAASALPTSAVEHRRVTQHPNAVARTTVQGHLTDAVTKAPISQATVMASNGSSAATSDATGKYLLTTYQGSSVSITAQRSGYAASTKTFITSGPDATVDFTLQPTPTITLKDTSGVVHIIDTEGAQFAYYLPFQGYARTNTANFCKADGTSITPDRSDFVQIIGPAAPATGTSCCSRGPVLGLKIKLKSSGPSTVYFNDSCFGSQVFFISRNHVTGEVEYYDFTKVAQIDFP